MTDEHPEIPTYVYDYDRLDALRPAVEAAGFAVPDDANDPAFAQLVNDLKADHPQLATQLTLSRIDQRELASGALLRQQAQALAGRENFMEAMRSRFSRKTTNGASVVDARTVGIAAAGVGVVALGVLMFMPKKPAQAATATATQTTTTAEATPTTDPAATTTVPASGLASPPPADSSAVTGSDTSNVSTVAPTASDLGTPSYTQPDYGSTSSTYSTPSTTTYSTPPAAETSSAFASPAPAYDPPATSYSAPASAAPVPLTPEPIEVQTSPTPAPVAVSPADTAPTPTTVDWSAIYTPPSTPTAPAAASTPSAGTVPAATAVAPAATDAPRTGRMTVVYQSGVAATQAPARTGRMAVWTPSGGQNQGAAPSAAAPVGTSPAAGSAAGEASNVVYQSKTTAGVKVLYGGTDAATSAPQNTQAAVNAVRPAAGVAERGMRVLYTAPARETAQGTAAPAAQAASGSQGAPADASDALPFQMGQVIPARMVVGVDLIQGAEMQFFVVTPGPQGNYTWKGAASMDASKRIQMKFSELALPNGRVVKVQATGVSVDGTVGVTPQFRSASPTAAINALQGAMTGVQNAANAYLQAGTTTVTGSSTTITKTPPPFWLSLASGVVNSFTLPGNTASVVTVGSVPQGTPINILFVGVGDGQP